MDRITLIVICSLLGYAASNTCIPNIQMLPCACHSNGSDNYMKCSNISSQMELDRVFNRTGSFDFDSLLLKDSKVEAVSAWSLREKSFRSIRISGTRMTDIFDETPGVYNSLESFHLDSVKVDNGIKWEQFQNLQKIENLVLKDVSVPELDSSFEKNFSKRLMNVFFYATNTSKLSDTAFAKRSHLRVVRIQRSNVTTLKRSMFSRSSRIQMFLFDNNQIGNLPEDMFSDMNKLARIGLGFNNISQVSEKTFGKVFNHLEALILEGNPIVCDCSLKWITERSTRGVYITGTCAHPRNLAGKELLDLAKEDFAHCST